jgi:hypothetical protein
LLLARLRPTASTARRACAAVAVLTAATTVLPGAPASGQQPPAGTTPIVQSWALAPTGTDPGEPSTRPSLSYTAEPGSTVNDSVTLWNYGNVQLTFRVYATDAFNNADGAFDLLEGAKTPKDLGAWLTVPVRFVTVPAHAKADLPVTLTIPAGAEPGDHAAGILASNEAPGTGPDGKTVTLDRRTGTRVYLRVGGPLHPALAVTKAHSVYHPSLDPRKGDLDVTYTVRNVGNVRLGASQAITVKNIFGRSMKSATPKPIVELLPGNEVQLTRHFSGVAATVRDGAHIRLTPTSVGDAAPAKADATSRTASTWAFPWLLLVLAVALTLLARGIRWYRQRPQGGRPSAPSSRPPTAARVP